MKPDLKFGNADTGHPPTHQVKAEPLGLDRQRRNMLRGAAAAVVSTCASSAWSNNDLQFRAPTRYVNSEHPDIVALVGQIAPSTLDPRERAVRIHDHVRDQIKFGWTSSFYEQSASDVLKSGVGFCNTKGTLFTAMLRAADIPARQHFVDIDAKIVSPFIDPGTPYLDHSFVEVWLGNRWQRTDSYVVDLPLHKAASRRLELRGQVFGFGVHRHGTSYWDGQSDSFCQFVRSATTPALSTRDHGIYEDVGMFYASGNALNRMNFLVRLGLGFFLARSANQRIEALRGLA